MATLTTTVSPLARFYYLEISANLHNIRRHLTTSTTRSQSGTYQRSDFTNQPYTGFYEPGGPTEVHSSPAVPPQRSHAYLYLFAKGPLRDAYTPPRITPTLLKQHLDAFVVGQERAKRTLATAVYNHYQRVQELQRRDEEEEETLAQEERRRVAIHPRHPVEGKRNDYGSEGKRSGIHVPALTSNGWEDEFPGQQQTTTSIRGDTWTAGEETYPQQSQSRSRPQQQPIPAQPPPLHDPTPLTISKSNILLLGPSGVGKTLMAQTLARVLEVPFSISDCTPFTQAGYIGEDAEVCVQRLLSAANYDVGKAERGIICLDELDKIASVSKGGGGLVGRDVGGEGVQQALLKIIEGTTVQVQAKAERGSGSSSQGNRSGTQQNYTPPGPTNSPLSGGNMNSQSGQQSSSGGPGQKGETYNVKTDNILFICAGAFNGLHKVILERISKGSIGFGATVRAAPGTSASSEKNPSLHETLIEGEDELYEKHLPFYTPPTDPLDRSKKRTHNTLDLVQPPDLQKYGLIPELVGRLPITCALSSLSISALVQVLTEPRNSLLKQYEHLFSLSSIELRFTSAALWSVAERASEMGTGARGLRTVMEGLLADTMFETPGSGVRHVLINEDVAKRESGAVYFYKGQGGRLRSMIEEEEERWEEKKRLEEGKQGERQTDIGITRTFEEYREKVGAAGG